ncbi:MAG TPA: hypothetical protein VKA67_00900, partial [Verrucomicrobiae bacterium]|nr:hypothetical protein [Verrucomicrobiae bacterium]
MRTASRKVKTLWPVSKLAFARVCGKLFIRLNDFFSSVWSRYLIAAVAGLLLAAAFPTIGVA